MKQIKYLAILASAFLYVGCGDSDTPTKLTETATDKVAIYTDADSIAYKSANASTWTTIDKSSGSDAGNGLKKYEIDKLDKFEVALFCDYSSEEGSLKKQNSHAKLSKHIMDNLLTIYAYTKDDGDIYNNCSKYTQVQQISGNITYNIEEGETPNKYYIAVDSNLKTATDEDPSFSYLYSHKNKIDLVSLATKESSVEELNSFNPLRFYINKNIALNTDITQNIAFNSNNSCGITPHNIEIGDAETDGYVQFISENKTQIDIKHGSKWYSTDSSCTLLNDKDTYVATSYGNHGIKLVSTPATSTLDTIVLDASNINELSGILCDSDGTINNLNYTPNANSPTVIAYAIKTFKNNKSYNLILSKNYLGSNTSYQLPNLTDVAGFATASDAKSIDEGNAYVVMSSQNLNKLTSSKKLFVPDKGYYYILYSGVVEYATQYEDIVPH